MFHLFKSQMLHIVRTKMVFLVLAFSFLVQYSCMKLAENMTFTLNSTVQIITADRVLFFLILSELAMGSFLTIVFGVWIMPHIHTGSRAPLSFTLPISKWKLSASYLLSFSVLIICQFLLMHLALGLNFGMQAFAMDKFPLDAWISALVLMALIFSTLLYLHAILAIRMGAMVSFLIGNTLVFVLSVVGGFLMAKDWQFWDYNPEYAPSFGWIYRAFPPFGEVFRQLQSCFNEGSFWQIGYLHWVFWILVGISFFRIALKRVV